MDRAVDSDLEVVPVAMAAGGDALARDEDGRVVFVEGALPGERVRARVVHAKKDFLRAVAVDVLDPSPDRVAPPCPGCSGCTWQHVAPAAQGRWKVAIVEDALRRIGRFDGRNDSDGDVGVGVWSAPVPVSLAPSASASVRATRTTVRLGVDGAGRAGQHRRGSRDVVVADAPCRRVHPALSSLIDAGRFAGADEVVLRVGVASGERNAWALGGSSYEVAPDVGVGPGAVVHESVAGAWLQVSIPSFFQAGPEAAEALVAAVDDAVGEALGAGGHLVDAYAGVGLFGATIGARRGARVTAIESEGSAVGDARVNLAEVDAVVVEGEVGRWRPGGAVDVVVADPARSGLGRPGVASLVASGAARIVLVSCDPASLARDARLLADAGWRPSAVTLVDAFPDTFHVEAVTAFDRA